MDCTIGDGRRPTVGVITAMTAAAGCCLEDGFVNCGDGVSTVTLAMDSGKAANAGKGNGFSSGFCCCCCICICCWAANRTLRTMELATDINGRNGGTVDGLPLTVRPVIFAYADRSRLLPLGSVSDGV